MLRAPTSPQAEAEERDAEEQRRADAARAGDAAAAVLGVAAGAAAAAGAACAAATAATGAAAATTTSAAAASSARAASAHVGRRAVKRERVDLRCALPIVRGAADEVGRDVQLDVVECLGALDDGDAGGGRG